LMAQVCALSDTAEEPPQAQRLLDEMRA